MCRHGEKMKNLHGKQCGCAACGEVFWTLTDFERHQIRPGGVFQGECTRPADLGLEEYHGAWGTPEGNRKRREGADRFRDRRKLVGTEQGSQEVAPLV